MRTVLSICRIMIWVVLAITMPMQIGAVLSIYLGKQIVNPILLIVATVLMIVSVILFFAIPRRKLLFLILAGIAGVLFILIALWFRDAFSVLVTSRGLAGISWWKAVYRHMSPALIPLLMLPLFLDYRANDLAKKKAAEEARTPTILE